MATYCTKCGGTGHTVNNNFCTCVDGKLLKAMSASRERADKLKAEAEAKEKAELLARIERTKKIMTADEVDLEKMVEDNLKEFNFELGQWAIVDGVVGVIVNIDGASRKVKFNGHHYESNRDRKYEGSNGWIDFKKVEPAPVEGFPDISLPMLFVQLEHELNINYALDTGNKELFMELTDSD